MRCYALRAWVLIQALTYSKTEREEQRRRGREHRKERKSVLLRQSRQSRRTRFCTKLRVRCDFFCTNATSGIMRRRRLTCACRKEQSDGIAIDTKSIASSSLPVGLCRRQKGETREEGGHMLDMFALTPYNFAKIKYFCKIKIRSKERILFT